MSAPKPKDPLDMVTTYAGILVLFFFLWPAILLWWVIRRPGMASLTLLTTVVFLGLSSAWIGFHNVLAIGQWAIVAVVLGLAVWWGFKREHFNEHARWRLAALWRKHSLYRRKWTSVARTHGLHVDLSKRPDRLPKLVKFRATPWADHLLVRPAKGSIKDWYTVAPALATAFDAPRCRVRKDFTHHDRFWLSFPIGPDRLASSLTPPPITEDVDLERVPVGMTEDGDPWTLRVLGSHLLVAGQIGSGKSVLVWSMLWGIAPLIRDGLVEVHAIDPKGGMELGPGRKLFKSYAQSNIDDMLGVIENVVKRLERRMAWCEEHEIRKHTPSHAEPFVLLIVDEGAVVDLLTETGEQARNLARWQKLILTQGRAPGFGLVTCFQEPLKDTAKMRGLYPQRVQHRSLERTHADSTLGPGSRERGAETETLGLPGMAFFVIDGETELQRGRSFHIEDHHIQTLVRDYAPAGSPGDRLRRVLEGDVSEPVRLSPEQTREKTDILRWHR